MHRRGPRAELNAAQQPDLLLGTQHDRSEVRVPRSDRPRDEGALELAIAVSIIGTVVEGRRLS